MKRFFCSLSLVLFCSFLIGCSEPSVTPETITQISNSAPPISDPALTAKPKPTATPAPTATPTPTPDPNPMPIIGGVEAVDVTLNMEYSFGIPAAKASAHSTGKSYYSSLNSDSGAYYDYTIEANPTREIAYVSFACMGKKKQIKQYLSFAASLPYDTCDSDAAKEWVSDNLSDCLDGEEIQAEFGNAIYTLICLSDGDGAELSIKAKGYSEYLEKKLIP